MKALNITETRKQLSRIVNEEQSVQFGNSRNQSVIVPYSDWEENRETLDKQKKQIEKMEIDLMFAQMDKILEKGKAEKRYTLDEVDAMVENVMGKHEKSRSS